MAEWLECWTCNSEAQSSKSCPDRWLDLFSVVPSSNPQSRLCKYKLSKSPKFFSRARLLRDLVAARFARFFSLPKYL